MTEPPVDSSPSAPLPFEAMRRWVDRARGSDTLRYFVGQGAYLLPMNFLGLALGFVSTILYARFLSPDEYGQFSYVVVTAMLLNVLALPGMITAIAQAASRNFDGFFARATQTRVRVSLLGSVVLAVMGVVCWHSRGSDLGASFLLAALLFPFYWALDGYWSVLSGKKQFGRLATLRLIQMLATAGATWVTLLLTRRVPLVLAANFGTMSLTNVLFYYWTRRHHTANDHMEPESLGYGKRLSALMVLINVDARVDQVMLGTFLPFSVLGWFNMASRMNDAFMKETWSVVAQMLFPRLAEVGETEARRRARAWGAYLIVVFAGLMGLFWLVAPLLALILGPAYAESIRLAKWLVLIHVINTPWSVYEVFAQARADEKGLWVTRLVVTAVHLATLLPLLRLWGVEGVLISIALSRVAVVAACAVMFQRRAHHAGS